MIKDETIPPAPASVPPVARSVTRAMKAAFAQGGKVAAADEAGNILLNMLTAAMGRNTPDFLQTPEGRQIGKFLSAASLFYGADVFVSEPKKQEAIRGVCELVMQSTSRDFLQPRMAALMPFVQNIIATHAGLAEEEEEEDHTPPPNHATTPAPVKHV